MADRKDREDLLCRAAIMAEADLECLRLPLLKRADPMADFRRENSNRKSRRKSHQRNREQNLRTHNRFFCFILHLSVFQ